MAGKPIPVSLANDMVTQYRDYVQRLGVDPNKKTQYVSFTLSDFLEWLRTVEPFSDELRICLGIYTEGSTEPGRVTAILWSYKDGSPSARPLIAGKDGGDDDEEHDPFNDGNSGP